MCPGTMNAAEHGLLDGSRFAGQNLTQPIGSVDNIAEGNGLADCPADRLGSVVRAGETYEGKQGLDYTPGISAESSGCSPSGLAR
jgi:hypothetical protein